MNARRLLFVMVAVAALGGAWATGRHLAEGSASRVEEEGRHAASEQTAEVMKAIQAELKSVEARAAIAGSNDEVKKLALQWTDSTTVRDFFESEAAWKPFRAEFESTLLVLSSNQGGGTGALLELRPEELVGEARARGQVGVVRAAAGKVWLIGASVVDIPPAPGQLPPVIMLAKPIGDALLQRLLPEGASASLLSDGRDALAAAGSPSERGRLSAAVGHERDARLGSPADAWFASADAIVPGLWLWSSVDERPAAARAEAAVQSTVIPIYVAAALIALVVLGLGFGLPRRGTPAPIPGPPVAPPLPAPPVPPAPVDLTLSDRTYASVPAVSSTPVVGLDDRGVLVSPSGGAFVPGVQFGRYTLVERLGQGGMGDVYLAVAYGAEGFKRNFVIKRLRAELAREKILVTQFIDEARMGSLLVHSNVIPVFDFGKVGEEYYLTQEYILGRDLEKLSRRSVEVEGRPISPAMVFYCAHQVLQALSFVHARTNDAGQPLHLVHRDISPQNVMVSARGEVKLFDFGIVKSTDRETKTQSGMVKGNISFMAPEQARGLEVDHRADLFSLGLVMVRILGGEILYRGSTAYDLMVRAATGLGDEEWARVDALPAPAPAILRRALQSEPSARFQSASEFASALPPLEPKAQEEATALVQRLVGEELRAERERLATQTSGSIPSAAPPPKEPT